MLVRGKGVRVYDEDGREYLDLLAGIGVGALGHGHEGLAAAIAEQSREMIHCSNLFFHPLQGQVAERLAKLSGLSRSFFCNSGAEAVEACLKFARRYWYTKGRSDRTEIIAMEGDFHGRTMGALSTTWDEHYRTPFMPLVPNVRFVPVNNPAALRERGDREHRGHHPRADSGRRWRATAHAGVRRCRRRSVPANRHAADCR